MVALRKESVDRNKNFKPEVRDWFKSLSARRAWIEIGGVTGCRPRQVALRKESVDRNKSPLVAIERIFHVALRKESVDRNLLLFVCCNE